VNARRRRNHWGWGYADEAASLEDVRAAAPGIAAHLGMGSVDVEAPVPLEAIGLPEPRLDPPAALASICSTDRHDRLVHARGRSYTDVVRGFRGRFDHVPDVVARPHGEEGVEAVLAWARDAGAKVVPYGGGTSVVGGVEPRFVEPAVSLDLTALDRVVEVDPVSRAARIQAGASGPRLEEQLREHGLTMRFYPQSFELSTLGGWIATRAAGHFAMAWTHVDDLVESVRAITPAGAWESRRLPGSGAGVSPDRMLLGSEGILGVVTEAWVRVQPRPSHRASRGVRFPTFAAGAEAVRALSQSGLSPANCRLVDSGEAALTGAGDGRHALLVLGFESTDHPVDGALERALALCAQHGGVPEAEAGAGGAEIGSPSPRAGSAPAGAGAVGSWRDAFLRAPYVRDTLVAMGVLSETFETAITWDRFPAFHAAVTAAVVEALHGKGRVSCRITHVYPDGPAPYFTVLAPAHRGGEDEQWAQIKAAASDAILAAGGTITHHHAVGRDHRPWYDGQRPGPFAAALRAAKAAVDPAGTLNPGVLIDPAPAAAVGAAGTLDPGVRTDR
jgi:alkyldihydroxyacetonephosphate synthase